MNSAAALDKPSFRDDDQLKADILAEQVAVFCLDVVPTLYSSILVTIGLTVFFWGRVPQPLLIAWLIYQLAVTSFRFATVRGYLKNPGGNTEVKAWLGKIRSGALLAGVGWGVVNLVLYIEIGEEYKILTACTLPAITGIALSTMSILPRTYPLFMLPVMLPFLAVNMLPGHTMGFGLALFGTLFIASLISTSRRLHKSSTNATRISIQNRMLKELADAANHAKSEFLSSVSHELRTPMTSVYGFAKLIKRKLDRDVAPALEGGDTKAASAMETVQSDLDVIVSESERLTCLINDVLDLAKLDAGKIEFSFREVDLAGVVAHVSAALSPLVAAKRLSLRLDVEEDLALPRGDRDRLVQLFLNLASNAVKFTEQGEVAIEAKREGRAFTVRVKDTGVGIAPENLERVFEKFFQIGDTLTEKPKGTGLGLPICKEIVERHGGRIWAESEQGVGSTFIFTLPCDPAGQ